MGAYAMAARRDIKVPKKGTASPIINAATPQSKETPNQVIQCIIVFD